MPSPKGLEMLIRKDQPTNEEWFGLLEARRALIKPHLDSFTLDELGTLHVLSKNRYEWHNLYLDSPVVHGDQRFSLKTQGIFLNEANYGNGWNGCGKGPQTKLNWCLTRSGEWVLITINFTGWSPNYERAESIEIKEMDIATIVTNVGNDPRRIWESLGGWIRYWMRTRRELYNRALTLANIVETEEAVLSLIPRY